MPPNVRIRSLERGDRAAFEDLFERLGPRSRHRRYFSPKPRLAAREVAYLTDVDHCHHEAITAVDPCGVMLGTARFVRHTGCSDVAEMAIEVADDHQGRCIGSALADRAIELARDADVAVLTATTLWDNGPARGLLAGHGFRLVCRHGGELAYELDLADAATPPQA